jgi:hypothetical protein
MTCGVLGQLRAIFPALPARARGNVWLTAAALKVQSNQIKPNKGG